MKRIHQHSPEMEIDVGVVFVDDFFAVYYYIFIILGFIKNAGQYFAFFHYHNQEIRSSRCKM